MKREDLLELIENGENSGVEFKRDDIRPEQLAREIVALLNLKGGRILLGLDDDGAIRGADRPDLETWVMNVCTDLVHPRVIPYYEEVRIDDRRVAVVTLEVGNAKPYVLRHKGDEIPFIRIGSTTRKASREDMMRLFQSGGFLHVETLPVSGTRFKDLDSRRIADYFSRVRKLHPLPETPGAWKELLINMELMTDGGGDEPRCTIAGLVLFGRKPRKHLHQAGIEWVVFTGTEKGYDTLDRATLDGPLVGLWDEMGEQIEDGILEGAMGKLRQHASREGLSENFLTRRITWDYAPEAVREALLNAFAHRDWTRPTDVEAALFTDRLEIVSPGALPNGVTVERMKQGLRIPRNPILIQTLKDYGYVEHMGMGVRNKIIAGMRRHNGTEPGFAADDLQVRVRLFKAAPPSNP